MAWTERRKRKWLAMVDGVMAFAATFGLFTLVYGLCNWVQGSYNHGYWKAGDIKMPPRLVFQLLQAIMPESWSLVTLLFTLPLAVGFLSFACSESLFTKVCRWLFVLAGLAVTSAVLPIVDIHGCLCSSERDEGWFDTGWDELFLPGLSVLFLYFSIRLARKRWSPITSSPSPSPSAMSRGDAPPSP